MTPLLDVVPPDDDEAASIEAALIRFADQVSTKWGGGDELYVACPDRRRGACAPADAPESLALLPANRYPSKVADRRDRSRRSPALKSSRPALTAAITARAGEPSSVAASQPTAP